MARAAREIAVARRTQSPRSWHANYGTKQGPPSALPRCPRCPRCEGPRRVAAELTASDRLQTLRGCDTRIQQGPKHRTHLLPGTDRGQPFFFSDVLTTREQRARRGPPLPRSRACALRTRWCRQCRRSELKGKRRSRLCTPNCATLLKCAAV